MAEDPGFLLVQAGLVRDDQLLMAREARAQEGGTLGEHLVMASAVDDDTLTAFYASKLVIPRVTAEELARIPSAVLRRIPADMAAEFRIVPVSSDGEHNLTLAMSDPADHHVVDEVAFFTGASVVRAVATQLQIAWCLAHYYGVMTPLARARLIRTGDGAAAEEAAGASSTTTSSGSSSSSSSSRRAVEAALAAAEPLPPDAIAGAIGEGEAEGPFPPGTPWVVEGEEETGPARMPIARRRRSRPRTSELAPRSGTLDAMPEPPPEPARLPAVVVDDEELTGRREFAGESDLPAEGDDEGDGDWADDEETYDSVDGDDDADGAAAHPANGEDERTVERRPGTEPILLERPRGRSPSSNGSSLELASGSGEILLLDQRKERARPPSGHIDPGQTDPGLGELGSVDSRAQASHDTGAGPGNPWAENQGENDTVRRQPKADRRGRKSRAEATTDPGEAGTDPMDPLSATPPAAAPDTSNGEAGDAADTRADSSSDESSEVPTDPGEPATNPMRRMSEGTGSGGPAGARSEWNVDDGWDVDDGWGPPGSTIPPEYIGARPDSYPDDSDDPDDPDDGDSPTPASRNGSISGAEAAALAAASAAAAAALAAVPAPLGATGSAPAPVFDESTLDPGQLAAELERSSNRLLETLRALERAPGRDEVVDALLDHLGGSMRRRAFFAVKGGALFAFRQYGAARPGVGTAELSLEQPSTFAQVALNRVAYRGTLSPAAIEFVEHALGSAGKGDAIVIPVEVRGKPVGLLYGDGLSAVVFEEHQTVLGRAAGQAFERILSKRAARESSQPS
ncbi:MAG TPA: hypothetical protein VKB80_02380 [Kofleriaceae bacterium]|nr:hypothetical protein [Kofleriaceae bacterium]